MKIEIKNIEYYLPKKLVTNEELEIEHPDWDMFKTGEKTGVLKRYIAEEDETAFDLSVKACEKLFSSGDIKVDDIGGIIYCTQSPDYIMPSNAFLIHRQFNFSHKTLAFDINLACSGYPYGLVLASSLIESNVAKSILFITADTYSKYINPKYRSASTLFGDGSSATLITKSENSELIDSSLYSSGKDFQAFYVPAGGFRIPKSEQTCLEFSDNSGNIRSQNDIYMDGFGVWKFIQATVPKQIEDLIKRNNYTKDDISLFCFHQASKMTLDSLVKSLKIAPEKAYSNIKNVGNTVSSSIPICMKDAMNEGKIKRGDLLLLSGFGVGLSWGSVLLRY